MRPLKLTEKPRQGKSLIEASAGTGKTYSISNLFLHFILQECPIQSILVVTFTDAATQELKGRIRDNLIKARSVFSGEEKDDDLSAIGVLYEEPVKKIDSALLNFDQASVFTIHGFCQRMLREYAFESSAMFEVELLQDDKKILEEVINDFWRQEIYPLNEVQMSYFNLKREDLMHLGNQLMQSPDLEFVDVMEEWTWQSVLEKHEVLKVKCKEVLKLFEKHKEVIKTRLYQGALSKASYKVEQFEHKFRELTLCLKTGILDKTSLEYFGANIERKCKKGELPPKHECFEKCEALSQLDWPDMEKGFSLYLKTKLKKALPEKLQEIKDRLEVMVFSDLIFKLYFVLQKEGPEGALHQKIRDKYQVVLVDEFQDTDPQQYEIFNSVFGHSSEHAFYMIGDPKQSIYAFRGADVTAYLKAKHQAEKYTLDTNYRSEKGMVDAVNHFFSQKDSREVFAYPPTEHEEGIVFEAVASGANKRKLVMSQHSALQLCWYEDPHSDQSISKSNVEHEFTKRVCSDVCHLLKASEAGEAYFEILEKNTTEKILPVISPFWSILTSRPLLLKMTWSILGFLP
jgi:exodeoxyribonuclease V beta subunit